MRRMISLFWQDSKLLIRNAMFWVLTVSLIAIILTVNFLIPEEFSAGEAALTVYGADISGDNVKKVSSPEEVKNDVKNNGTVGLIYGNGKIEVIHDGLSDKAVAALVSGMTPPSSLFDGVELKFIRHQEETIPQNIRMMPAFISFEAIVLGFLMAAIILLGEKQEMVLKAYRISPGGTMPYILSKTLLFSVVGTLYASLMTLFTIGFSLNWGEFVLLSFLGCALYTLLGLSLAVFFKDMSSWFFSAVLILSLNLLPSVSYSVPSFSPAWLQYIPSYPILFSYSQVLFQTGKSIAPTLLPLICEIAAAALLCGILIKKKLLSSN